MSVDLSVLGKRGEQVTLSQVRKVDLLPNGAIKEIGPMANPDEDFQSTDVRRGKELPTRRLAVAGVSESLCIIHYERGGIGRNWILAILELTGGKAKGVWISNTQRFANLNEIKAALESGKLQNQLGEAGW